MMNIICRKANREDIDAMYELIQRYAEKGIMLPRSKEMLNDTLNDFIVAEIDGQFAGCGSLCQLGKDLVEIRSLGIADEFKGRGIGSKLVHSLIQEAKAQNFPKIMALTYEVSFFERNGFEVVEMEIFPEKVWKDCVFCSKRDQCDEIAVIKHLN